MRLHRFGLAMGLAAAAGLGLVSCSDQGEGEKTGQQIDQTMQQAKDKAVAAEEKAKAEASAAGEKASQEAQAAKEAASDAANATLAGSPADAAISCRPRASPLQGRTASISAAPVPTQVWTAAPSSDPPANGPPDKSLARRAAAPSGREKVQGFIAYVHILFLLIPNLEQRVNPGSE